METRSPASERQVSLQDDPVLRCLNCSNILCDCICYFIELLSTVGSSLGKYSFLFHFPCIEFGKPLMLLFLKLGNKM
jgi:hypothetical protein